MLVPAVPADLCLSYANTRSWRGCNPPTESLKTLPDLLAWLDRSAGIGPRATGEIASWARRHEKAAANLFSEAVALREAVFRIFRAVSAGEPVREPDFAALSHALALAPPRRQLVRSQSGYGWRLSRLPPTMPALLAPVLWSAADLIIAGGPQPVRQCANATCLWLFLDASKNGTRRWCDMASCGNRAKARRHYLKRSRG